MKYQDKLIVASKDKRNKGITRKILAVRMFLFNKENVKSVANNIGVSEQSVYNWVK